MSERAAQIVRGFQDQGVNIARLTGALASAIAGGDGDDVSLGANLGGTAAENNVAPVLLLLLAAASAAYTTVDVANVYVTEGPEAALEQLAIDGAISIVATGAGAVAYKVGGKLISNADDAYRAAARQLNLPTTTSTGLGSNFILRADNVRDISEETVDIFRSVSQAELDDLVRTGGEFRINPGGFESKQFGRSLEEIKSLSQSLDGNDVIIRVRIPKRGLSD